MPLPALPSASQAKRSGSGFKAAPLTEKHIRVLHRFF